MAFSAFTKNTENKYGGSDNLPLSTPLAASNLVDNSYHPVAFVDHDCDIESIAVRFTTAGSNVPLVFKVAASGTALASGTSLGSGTTSGLSANTAYELGLSSNTGIAAGSVIGVGGATNITSLAGLIVTTRVTKNKLTSTDAGTRIRRDQNNNS